MRLGEREQMGLRHGQVQSMEKERGEAVASSEEEPSLPRLASLLLSTNTNKTFYWENIPLPLVLIHKTAILDQQGKALRVCKCQHS